MSKFVLLIFCYFLSACVTADSSGLKKVGDEKLAELVMKCKYCVGFDGPGGVCFSGPGGAVSTSPGGECYAGPGGALSSAPGAALSVAPGGACSESPGGNCSKGPGSDGKNCSLACRLNKK